MVTGGDVLQLLIPTGGWVIQANDFDSIRYDDGVKPITKKQFEDGFTQYDALKIEQEAKRQAEAEAKAAQRQALLNRLGITEEEARILLGGN